MEGNLLLFCTQYSIYSPLKLFMEINQVLEVCSENMIHFSLLAKFQNWLYDIKNQQSLKIYLISSVPVVFPFKHIALDPRGHSKELTEQMIKVILLSLNAQMTEICVTTKSCIFLLNDINPFPVQIPGQGFPLS